MDRTALHLEVRNALSLADELSRHEHALGNDELTAHLSALRTSLDEIERDVGKTHDGDTALVSRPTTIESVMRSLGVLRSRRDELPALLRPRLAKLLASGERVVHGELRPWARIPSKPVLGMLPLARVVPQDVHSVQDYLVAGAYAFSASIARTPEAKATGALLGASVLGTSLVTDYRLSLAKIVPIEMHEVADHVSGLSAVIAPFALGYWKKDPIASVIQIVSGISTIIGSLFTDYRAEKGVTLPIRSKGGPSQDLLSRETGEGRVPEVQRPLEGLSSAPTDWDPDLVNLQLRIR